MSEIDYETDYEFDDDDNDNDLKICQPLVIIRCRENYRRLTKLEYLVLLIIKNFGNIQLQDKETKEYYWPDMSECVSHYLRTEKFDEVLEVVMEELARKKLLDINRYCLMSYIKLKLNEVKITEAFDGGITYDKFKLDHKFYKLIDDEGELSFKAISETKVPKTEPCKKYKGKNCLVSSVEEIQRRFREYIGRKYPDHKDDILIETYVYPNMVDFDAEAFEDKLFPESQNNSIENIDDKSYLNYCFG